MPRKNKRNQVEGKRKLKISVVSSTEAGRSLGERVKKLAIDYDVSCYTSQAELETDLTDKIFGSLSVWSGIHFERADAMLFIGPAGVAVHMIAPLLRYKGTEPAVFVMDDQGTHLIPLLNGRAGIGYEMTLDLAILLEAEAILTQTTDPSGKISLVSFAKKNHLVVSDTRVARRIAVNMANGKTVQMFCDGEIVGMPPQELRPVREEMWQPTESGVWISAYMPNENQDPHDVLHLVPQCVVMGIACKQNTSFETVEKVVNKVFRRNELSLDSITIMASMECYWNQTGLEEFSQTYDIPFRTFDVEELMSAPGTYPSGRFSDTIDGVDNVCERAAVSSAVRMTDKKEIELIQKRVVENGVEIALIMIDWSIHFDR